MKHKWIEYDRLPSLGPGDPEIIKLKCDNCGYNATILDGAQRDMEEVEKECNLPDCEERLLKKIMND